MQTAKTKRSKAIRRLLIVIVVVVALLALLPVWFPWVLKPILNRYGLDFAHYDRTGYTRFALGGVTGNWKGTRLEAKQVQCVLPTTWVWKKIANGTSGSPFLTMAGGELKIAPKKSGAKPSDPKAGKKASFDRTLNQIVRIGQTLDRFLPVAQLTNCSIQIVSNRTSLSHVDWRDSTLLVTATPAKSRGPIELSAKVQALASLELSIRSKAYQSAVEGAFSKSSDGWRWEGVADWLTNRATITAQIATNGWWPVAARLDCTNLNIPATLVQLHGYENVAATLAISLVSNQFNVQTTGFARPSTESIESGFPKVDFWLEANGNPDVVNLEKLHVQSPWLNANLTNSVSVTWHGELLAKPAVLQVALDLNKIPGPAMEGQASAEVRVEPHRWEEASAQFICSATNIRAWEMDAERIELRGEFAAANLKLDEVVASFADGSRFEASGALALKSKVITNGTWKFTGGYLKKFLSGMSYGELTTSGQAQGPLTNLSHQGEATIKDFQSAGLRTLNAEAKWAGRNLRVDSVNVDLVAGESALAIRGGVDLSAIKEHKTSATLTNLTLRRQNDELLSLQRPCAISFTSGGTNSGDWKLAVDRFDWKGANRAISLDANVSWSMRGNVTATVSNLALNEFSDIVTNELPNVSLAALNFGAQWSNGPVHSDISIVGALTNRLGKPFALRCDVATRDSLSINNVSLESGYAPTLVVTGNIPVQVVPGRSEGLLSWNESQPIALVGNSVDAQSQQLSFDLGKPGAIEISKPTFHFQVSGTLEKPLAMFNARAAVIAWQSPKTNALNPRLEDFEFALEVQPEQIKLEKFAANLDGQPLNATGEWPLSALEWNKFWTRRKLPDWANASGRLQIADAKVAAVARYLPQVLAPEGRLSAEVELKTGRQVTGNLSLTNAATRPLGKITPLREIAAQVRFEGDRATLKEFHGEFGGQPIRADGFVTLAREGLDYQVNVVGTNVPLARDVELLLRGDLNLRLRGGSNQPPVVSGTVNLHDGLYLQHASALVWSGPERPELRPPYFSVTNQPLADWQLDLTASGGRFLRARTPIFNGVLSANLKLTGTLGQPILIGDVRADSGRITFPFGTLDVDQGYASFTGNDLQGPDLQINASGQNFNYDLRLDVKGAASVADVTFSSTPPLTSEQIVLMLTAGELPQSDFTYSRTARAGRFATFVGKDLLSRYLGSDRGEERLIIRSGESISEEGRLTYSVEYRLTPRWSIIGEYDEYNAFNADVRWKIFTR